MNSTKRPWLTQEQSDDIDRHDEWVKTQQRQFIVDFDGIYQMDGKVVLCVRNDDNVIRIGDCFGGQEIRRIEAYGKDLDSLSPGTTGALTFDAMPGFVVLETYPEFADWLRKVRDDRARISGSRVAPCGDVVQASPEEGSAI